MRKTKAGVVSGFWRWRVAHSTSSLMIGSRCDIIAAMSWDNESIVRFCWLLISIALFSLVIACMFGWSMRAHGDITNQTLETPATFALGAPRHSVAFIQSALAQAIALSHGILYVIDISADGW